MNDPYYIGRDRELARWTTILDDPSGEVVVVVGEPGRGKTVLLDHMVEVGRHHSSLCVAAVRYEALPTDSPGMIMRTIMEDAFSAARAKAGQFESVENRFAQWNAAIDRLGLAVAKGTIPVRETDTVGAGDLGCYELLSEMRYDPSRNVFDQFRRRLILLSQRIADTGRLLIIIDPKRGLCDFRIEQWHALLDHLPPKIKLLFAQRPHDPLASAPLFRDRKSVRFLCETSEGLPPFTESETDRLVAIYRRDADETETLPDLKNLTDVYRGEPLAVRAVLEMLVHAGARTEDLPKSPEPEIVAAAQWALIPRLRLGNDAAKLFRAYAILETCVPDAIACAVAGVERETFRAVIDDRYFRSFFHAEPAGRRLYHGTFADVVGATMRLPDGSWGPEAKHFHQRAALVYFGRLNTGLFPDSSATVRLPEHALHYGGPDAFTHALGFCDDAFLTLKLYVTYANLLQRGLDLVEPGSLNEVELHFRLGRLRVRQGAFEEAREQLFLAREHLKKYDNPRLAAQVAMELGHLHLLWNRPGEAEGCFRDGIAFYRSIDDTVDIIEGLRQLAETCIALERPDDAAGTLREARKLCDTITIPKHRQRTTAGILCAIGKLEESRNDFEAASRCYHEALDLTQDIYDRESEAGIRLHLRDVGMLSGKTDVAEKNQREAIRIYEELNLNESAAEGYFYLANLLLERGAMNEARKHLRTARELFVQMGNLKHVEKIDRMLNEDLT